MGAITGTMFAILFSALAGGIWIGLTLGATGAVLLALFRSIPLDKLLAQYAWNILTTQELLALPMFILMGEILFQSRLSRSLFAGLAPWAGLLPGRLLHVNVVGCSIFAAISGSSAATTQVVGRMALTELLKRGYSKDIAIGSLAGASSFSALMRSNKVRLRRSRSVSGTRPGRSVVWIMTQAMKQPASRKPGMNPAVNSLRIETSPSTP